MTIDRTELKRRLRLKISSMKDKRLNGADVHMSKTFDNISEILSDEINRDEDDIELKTRIKKIKKMIPKQELEIIYGKIVNNVKISSSLKENLKNVIDIYDLTE